MHTISMHSSKDVWYNAHMRGRECYHGCWQAESARYRAAPPPPQPYPGPKVPRLSPRATSNMFAGTVVIRATSLYRGWYAQTDSFVEKSAHKILKLWFRSSQSQVRLSKACLSAPHWSHLSNDIKVVMLKLILCRKLHSKGCSAWFLSTLYGIRKFDE